MAEHSAHEPPGLPTITDEAADTPMWMPVLGLSLLGIFALLFVYRAAVAELAPTEAPPVPFVEPAAAPAEPTAAPTEPAEPPSPPADPHAGHGHPH